MDSWANDSFFKHFPSYSEQPNQRKALALARQLEYQTFLDRVTPRNGKSDGKGLKRQTTNDSPNKRQKIPTNQKDKNDLMPKNNTNNEINETDNGESVVMNSRIKVKNKFLDELEKMDLPDIFNEKSINERNEKAKEDKRLRTIRYQEELMEQIQQKRRERELQKAKEEEEEEKLTKRMEEQLKMVRLQDELESQRQTRHREKSRFNLDLNRPILSQQSKPPPTTVRSEKLEPVVQTTRSYDERKVQSDRGKENCNNELKRNDKDIYNFFTNSAQKHKKDVRYNHYFDLEDVSETELLSNSMSSSTYNTYPSKSNRHKDITPNKKCSNDKKQPVCNFCKYNRNNRLMAMRQEENSDYMCDSCENEPICLNCRKEICFRCKRTTKQNDDHTSKVTTRHLKQRNNDRDLIVIKQPEQKPKPKYVRLDNFQPIYTDEDDSLSEISSNDHKPYSFNIDESSVFHPSRSRVNRRLSVSIRNGEVFVKPDFDELKRVTEEKLQKYAKTYGDFLDGKPNVTIGGKNKTDDEVDTSLTTQDSSNIKPKKNFDTMPAMRENTKQLIEFAKELERSDNIMFKRIKTKYQIPSAGQANKVTQNNDTISTLTQVGAFKQQLHLDKLNF